MCAGGVRAVLEVRIRSDEVAYGKFAEAIPSSRVLLRDALDERVRRDERTPFSHAPDRYLLLITDLTRNVHIPARRAKGMIAREAQGFSLRVIEADGADEWFVGG